MSRNIRSLLAALFFSGFGVASLTFSQQAAENAVPEVGREVLLQTRVLEQLHRPVAALRLSETPVYIYHVYFDEKSEEIIHAFAIARIESADGSFEIRQYDPKDFETPTNTTQYSSTCIPQEMTGVWNGNTSGIKYAESEATILWKGKTTVVGIERDKLAKPHLGWFWKATPAIGESVVEESLGQNTGELMPSKTFTYVRREKLTIVGEEVDCHVVEERRENNANSLDTYWFDEGGRLVKQIHDVGGEMRTTILARKEFLAPDQEQTAKK